MANETERGRRLDACRAKTSELQVVGRAVVACVVVMMAEPIMK